MNRLECQFEADVLAAVLQSRWPERVDPPLAAHVAGCSICSDVAAIAPAFESAREESRAAAVLPDSGRVWWLAQLRARREASQAASRPITAVLVAAILCSVGLLAWIASTVAVVWVGALAAVLLILPAAALFVLSRD